MATLLQPGLSSTRRSTRSSPRQKDSACISTSGDSRNALRRPEHSITICYDNNEDNDEDNDKDKDKDADKDKDIEPDDDNEEDPAPPTTPTPSNQNQSDNKKKAAAKKQMKTSSVQKLNKRNQTSAVKNFEHPNDVDINQVTNDEGKQTGFRKATSDDVAFLLTYYKDPEFVKGKEHTGIKQKLTCKWCNRTFTRGDNGNLNLYGHRDGYKKRKPCAGRQSAIKAGVYLPPTWKKLNEPVQVAIKPGNTIKLFLSASTFSVELLNVILVIWILRHALPWMRFQDPTL
ncbi:hypothetical protein DFH28DRAFT_1172128 [Melampsora americana]|nr:hypothetical protein DFH28DRAFT_1172128 [Melampsora americana]